MKNIPTSHEEVFSSEWFKINSKFYGNDPKPYLTLASSNSIICLAIYKDNVILINQFRQTYDEFTLELPSGHIDDNEEPSQAAKRELLEETGFNALEIQYLGELYPDTGRLTKKVFCFYTDNVVKTNNLPEKGISVNLQPIKMVKELIVKNSIKHAQDIACITLAILNKKI